MYKLLIAVFALVTVSFSAIIPVTPPPNTLTQFEHDKAYLWRINLAEYIPDGETLESAILYIDDVNNVPEPDYSDVLYVDLVKLNYAGGSPNDVRVYTNDGNGDRFMSNDFRWSEATSVATYSDNNSYNEDSYYWGGWGWIKNTKTINPTQDLAYSLNIDKITEYMDGPANGWLGIGFDGDCHYGFSSVRLELVTAPTTVPEPTLLSLLGCGLLGMAFFRRKK